MEDDACVTAESDQVSRYWGRYRLVLVTNTRDFVLVGTDGSGDPAKLETFRLAESTDDFWRRLAKPRLRFARAFFWATASGRPPPAFAPRAFDMPRSLPRKCHAEGRCIYRFRRNPIPACTPARGQPHVPS